jgi:hypothetical protein
MDYARMFGAYAILWTAMSAVVDYAFHRLAGWPLETPARTTSSALLMSAVLVYANVRTRRVDSPTREDVNA